MEEEGKTYNKRQNVIKISNGIDVMNSLEEPFADSHSDTIIDRLECSDAWISFASPRLEVLCQLFDPREMICAAHAHDVEVEW